MSKLKTKFDSISLKDKFSELLESIDRNNTSKLIADRYYRQLSTLEVNEGVANAYTNKNNPYSTLDRIAILEKAIKELKAYDWTPAVKKFIAEGTAFINENQSYILVESVIRDLETNQNAGYYTKAISALKECSNSDNVDFAVVETLESEQWIPLVKRLYEYCNKVSAKANGKNPNFKVSKIYSPVEIVGEGFLFHSNGKNLIVNEDTITESAEKPTESFSKLLRVVESAKFSKNSIRMYPNYNSLVDIVFEGEDVKVSLNGKEVESKSLESAMLASGFVKIGETDKISNIYRAISEGKNIKEIDFGYTVTSSVYEGLSATVFNLNDKIYIQKVNKGMKENSLVEAANATEAVQIVKDFMNYDITESISSLVESENAEAEKRSKEIAKIESRIKFIMEKLSDISASERVIGKSEILNQAKELLESELATQNSLLEAAKSDADGFKPSQPAKGTENKEAKKPEAEDKKENFKPENAPKGSEEVKVEVEVKGSNDTVEVPLHEEKLNESSIEVGKEYTIKGKPGYIYQGVADGYHIFNQKDETDPTPVHMKEEEFQAALAAGEISK